MEGFWVTAIRAPDFTQLGMFTGHLSAGMMTLHPTEPVVDEGPGRSVVWPEQRSKNLSVYATWTDFCGDEK